jgi:multiple sugar transport system permease protein
MSATTAAPLPTTTTPATAAAVRPSRTPGMPAWAWWVLCTAVAVLFAYPLYVMTAQSLKAPAEAVAAPPTLYPHHWSLRNYVRLFNGSLGVNLLDSLRNSAVVTAGATFGTIVLATLAGYGFAKLRFPGSNLVFFAMLASFMIPFQAIITPLYLILQHLGLQNSLLGLVLVYVTFNLPFGVFIMRNSFATLPASLEEAALIDGCTTLGALRRVLLPVALPGIITTALFTFFAAWNEFFAALILITDQSKFTLPVSLTLLTSGDFGTVNWGSLEAGVVVTVLPCVVIYLLLQKYYVGGLLAGAVK